ncbi:hypothetical protein [Burkholderia pseudomallei]
MTFFLWSFASGFNSGGLRRVVLAQRFGVGKKTRLDAAGMQ